MWMFSCFSTGTLMSSINCCCFCVKMACFIVCNILNVEKSLMPVCLLTGDIFSCHAVDNPKPQAELAMLKQYGPDVPQATLQKLVAAFGELRSMADQGTISYPYSTREVVNIVKHLQVKPHRVIHQYAITIYIFNIITGLVFLSVIYCNVRSVHNEKRRLLSCVKDHHALHKEIFTLGNLDTFWSHRCPQDIGVQSTYPVLLWKLQ